MKNLKLPSATKLAQSGFSHVELLVAVVVIAAITFTGAYVYLSNSHADTSSYPDPNGTHWHCQEYKSLYSWDCISGYGWLYGGIWAFVSDFYQHPHPSTDEVVNEAYFNQNGPNGMAKTAQWRHRVIAVNDGAVNGLVEPFNWRVSMGDNNPPAPTTCLVLTGDQQGQQIPCTSLVQKSILDYWHQASVIPNQIYW